VTGGRPARASARGAAALALLLLGPGVAGAGSAVDPDAEGTRLAQAYLSRTQVSDPALGMSLETAYDAQRRFVKVIVPSFGSPAGYKAALTSPAAREALHAAEPVVGVLLHRMFIPDGGRLPARFGARPLVEADLMVRVGSEAINTARNAEEALACLDAVMPFIELPDLLYAPGVALDAGAIAAANAGARHGVLGPPIPLSAPLGAAGDWRQRLRSFRAELVDPQGRVVGTGSGADLLGDPVRAVLWLRDTMRERGALLRRGALLSLGTLVAPVPATPGTWTVRYTGLDPVGDTQASITLTP
jgi:2-keto-4-pentenoate hydratase